ncbi:hypothetical protein GQX74_009513 [Glossina fuscipes]|nr:hypothetical protein GQX74_009513 [Glossina fuscipes]
METVTLSETHTAKKIYYHFCKRLVAGLIGRCSAGAAKTLFADLRALSEAEVFRNAAAQALKPVVAVLVAATGERKIFVKSSVILALKVKPLPEGVGVSFDFVVVPKRFADEGPLPKTITTEYNGFWARASYKHSQLVVIFEEVNALINEIVTGNSAAQISAFLVNEHQRTLPMVTLKYVCKIEAHQYNILE